MIVTLQWPSSSSKHCHWRS